MANISATNSKTIYAPASSTYGYVLKVTLNNWSVKALWRNVWFTFNKVTYKPASATTSTTDTSTTITKNYSISSTKPTFAITKNGNKINVTITNDSDYDMDLAGFVLQVIWNVNDNGINPLANSLGAWAWTLQDTNGNVLASTAVSYASNFAAVAFGDEEIKAGESATYVVVMPQQAAIQSSYYEAEERYVEFNYVDDGDVSDTVKADYNGWAAGVTLPAVTSSLLIAYTGNGDLFWAIAADLQSGVVVSDTDNTISWTLNKTGGYYAAWWDSSLWDHYLALQVVDTTVEQVYINNPASGIIDWTSTTDPTKDVVVLQVKSTSDSVKVVKNGSVVATYSLAWLTLAE